MKNHMLIVVAVALFSGSAFGQTSADPPKPPAKAKTAEPAFPREKFDPTRDAKADLEKAVAEAKKAGKNIILDVGGEWCSWCVYMDKFFYQHPDITKLRDDNFIWLKINMSQQNENKAFLSAYPEAAGYPHLYVLDPAGSLLQWQDTSALEMDKGYNPDKFIEFLNKWSPDQTPAAIRVPPIPAAQ